jgi:hypothetical protein
MINKTAAKPTEVQQALLTIMIVSRSPHSLLYKDIERLLNLLPPILWARAATL